MTRRFVAIWSDNVVGTVCAIEADDEVFWCFGSTDKYDVDDVLKCEKGETGLWVGLPNWKPLITAEKFTQRYDNCERGKVSRGTYKEPDWLASDYSWSRERGPYKTSSRVWSGVKEETRENEHAQMAEFFFGKRNDTGCNCGAWKDGGGHYDWCDLA